MTIKHDIDKLFKQGLSDYSEKPPNFVWDNIDYRLNRKRYKRKKNIMYSLAASVALLLSFGAGYLFTDSQSENLVVLNQNITTPQIISEPNTSIINNTKTNNTIIGDSKNIENSTNNKATKPNNNNNASVNSIKDNGSVKQDSDNQKNKSVKKATSQGILLAPMFATSNNFDANKTQIANNNNTDNTKLNTLEMRGLESLPQNKNSELMYDIRQIPIMPDYTTTNINKKGNVMWSVGISATPLMSYRKVENVSSDLLMDAATSTNYEQNYTNEKPYVSYSAGVGVNCKVAKRWRIQSGLYFSELGQISENIALTGNQPYAVVDNNSYYINTSTGNIKVQGNPNELINRFSDKSNIDNDLYATPPGTNDMLDQKSEFTADFLQTYEYYEIPVAVNYTIIDRKLSVNMTGGISANIMYNNKTYIQNNNSQYELNTESTDLKNMNYSGIFGLGLEYPIITKLNFSLQPTFRYSLNSINNSNTVYPYSFGIYTGLRYNF